MTSKASPWFTRSWFLLLALAAVALLVFHALWSPGAILMCSDNNVGNVAAERAAMRVAPPHEWFAQLWGLPFASRVTLPRTLQMLLPPVLFTNTIYALCLLFGAWFLTLYLRDKGVRPWPACFGGLVAFWTGTNLTLVYAGHLGKYGVLLFLSVALWALGRWGRSQRSGWVALAAAAIGAMFLEQVDVAAFCTLLLAPAALYELLRFPRATLATPRFWLAHILPAGVIAMLIVLGAAAATLTTGAADNVDDMTPAQQWSYLTQWSQPPAESLDFIAPGWTGWRSGDPEGPYWGVMGRSDDWPANRSGFMNFKLENVYVGAIPLVFALLAIGAAFATRKTSTDACVRWHFVLLWTCLCLAALLLAFGKFTPLYRLVALLPGFSVVRNPNKFIHFFQLAWGVLAALGLDSAHGLAPASRRRWAYLAYGLTVIFAISWLVIWSDAASAAAQLSSSGWPLPAAKAIVAAKAFALLWAALSLLVAALVLHFWPAPPEAASLPTNATSQPTSPAKSTKKNTLPFNGKSAETRFHSMEKVPKHVSIQWKHVLRSALPAVPVLMLLLDAAVILAPHYLQAMPHGYIAKNDAIDYLQTHLDGTRMAFPQQDGFYNFWLTYLFLYYDIPTISATQVPHPPADYTAFWGAVRDPVRLWRLTAVSTLFMHGPAAASLLADPTLGPQFRLDWAYQPADDGDGGIATRPLPLPDPATPAAVARLPEVALQFKDTPPRVALPAELLVLDDTNALVRLADPAFVPLQTAILSPEAARTLGINEERTTLRSPADAAPTVSVTAVETGRIRFTAHLDRPGLARIADKFDPGWKATLDGESVPVLRCDYMFQGVWLPAGDHDVEVVFRPTSWPLRFQILGLVLALLLILPLLRPRPCPAA